MRLSLNLFDIPASEILWGVPESMTLISAGENPPVLGFALCH
jgi:hypothetical protein